MIVYSCTNCVYLKNNNMNKNTRKNSTNIVVTWPSKTLFTTNDLFESNPQYKLITLRIRLAKAIENKMFVEVGSLANPSGRPTKVYSKTPVSKTTLDMAEKMNVQLVEKAVERLINVVSITSDTTVTPTVTPTNISALNQAKV